MLFLACAFAAVSWVLAGFYVAERRRLQWWPSLAALHRAAVLFSLASSFCLLAEALRR